MDKKTILKQIKELINFSSEAKFKDAKLIDNETIIHVDGETFEVGAQLHVVTPDGMIPAPAGQHTTLDGDVITVDEAGIITAVEKVEPAPAGKPTAPEQALADENFYTWDECMIDMMNEYDDEAIASAVCGKIKSEGNIMSKEEAFAEAETIVKKDEEVKVEGEVKTEDLGKKLYEMEARIAEVEKMMNEMLPTVKQTAEFGNSVLNKIDGFVADTPAQHQFASIKTEYKQLLNNKKTEKVNGIESIKNIRKK